MESTKNVIHPYAEILRHLYPPKEKTMSTDYDAGYKAGVEKATEPLYTPAVEFSIAHDVNKKLSERRDKLLTKKVTKYAIVCSRSRGSKARAYFIYEDLFEGKQCAETKGREITQERIDYNFHGVFPIEIEIPL